MRTSENLIAWKTNAWQEPAMVADYAAKMASQEGPVLLKNRLEIDAILMQTIGQRILDVGIGTGRGSLPLAKKGKQVTGVDISQAMLDECQRIAKSQGLSIQTQTAPLDSLPFSDGSFDSLISLNTLMHFPHWRQILPEWTRVVHSGGRLIFDLHSLDHYRAGIGKPVSEEDLQNTESGAYVLCVAAEDLVAEAERHGLLVIRLIPYGAFLGGGNRNYLRGALEDKEFLKRLLSWMAADASLLEFACFLEQELIWHLTTMVTGRFMAVFEKRADKKGNRAWLKQNRILNDCLRKVPIDLEGLAPRLGRPLKDLRHHASGTLSASMRCRRLLDCLATPLVDSGRLQWSDIVEPPLDSYFIELAKKREADRLASQWSRHAGHDVSSVAQILNHNGVPLGGGLEYGLVEPLLTQGLGRFTGVRS